MASKRLINFYKDEKRSYEVTLIFNQILSADNLKNKIETLSEIAKSCGANIRHAVTTGLKSYCYPIQKTNNKKGYYGSMQIDIKPENVSELNRKFSIQNDVLRVMVILSDPRKQSFGIFSNSEEDNSKNKNKIFAYDDPNTLIKFLGERGRIEARKPIFGKKIPKGLALKQRNISKQIKRARFLSLLPYVEE